jgi:hypothetical protein
MKTLKEIMAGIPTKVTLSYGSHKAGAPQEGLHPLEIPPEEVVVVFQFSETGFGFGEITIVQTQKGVFVDTECMGREKVQQYLSAFLASAILDTDVDPEKHALYNEERGSRCGGGCRVCFPDGDPED